MAAPQKVPIEQGIIARAIGAARFVLTGVAPETWMSPGQPLPPVPPKSMTARAFDYPVAQNMVITTRAPEPITFAQLRGLADGSDVVRLAIETRKDQMERLDWVIQRKDADKVARTGKKLSDDAKADKLMDFFRMPDREHEWATWLRMLLEDVLVIDAATVYMHPTRGGQLYSLEVLDGATIKRLLNADGRTPVAPDPAYQQILKGVPAVDFNATELLYLPRNPRPQKIYGMSPVEQIIVTVNTAIRRALHQLDYYTDGTLPDTIIGVPSTWTPDNIQEFQAWWDSQFLGPQNSKERRGARFVPDGLNVHETKTAPLFDIGDEWLVRVICYAFSLPPTAFTKQTNRATATTAQEVALEEGLAPLMLWVKRMVDRVLAGPLGASEYEFAWRDDKDIDRLVQAQVDDLYIKNGTKTIAEVREALDLPPLPEPSPVSPALGQPGDGAKPGTAAGAGPAPTPGVKPPLTEPPKPSADKVLKLRAARRSLPPGSTY